MHVTRPGGHDRYIRSMRRSSYYIINAITVYRIAASLVLLALIFSGRISIFKWLLGISFFTDAIDGFLARRYRVSSVLGARLDSIGDDLTVLMGIIGLAVFRPGFITEQWVVIAILLALFLLQLSMAFYKYGRFTSFHTWLAKIAALAQGSFLILCFFLPACPLSLFYVAAVITGLDLIEEIILVALMPKWKTDVKGIFWLKDKTKYGDKSGTRLIA